MPNAAFSSRLLFTLARLIGALPICCLRALGTGLGELVYRINSRETQVVRCNLKHIALPTHSASHEPEIRALMHSTGQTLMETLAIWTRPRAAVLSLVREVHGEPHLREALSRGKGVLLAVPHYGNWELVIEYMAARGPFSLVYRAAKNPTSEAFLQRARQGENVRLVPAEATAMRPLLRALQNGECVGITPDHQPKEGGGEFALFFGQPALSLSLIAKLAQRTGAPVLFAFAERCGSGFSLHFEAEEPGLHNPDMKIALQAMNNRVQSIAERDFRQYQWTYKRFSIRQDPLNVKNPYR